ncbi:MAG: hypothetical protein CMH92_06225 [Oceanicaulis sp.]|jgi:hypothetical protein|nr:hypothetical protein [Oceanicaulis sp.]|tara:strand:- start:36 stop:368 length:333 start_codon:yes stop_codon:yes gene_type:complete
MTYTSSRGFAPPGSRGLPGEIGTRRINPDLPLISTEQLVRGLLFFVQALASVALIGLFAIQIYGMLFWDASGRHLPLLEIVFGVYVPLMAVTFFLTRLVQRKAGVETDPS